MWKTLAILGLALTLGGAVIAALKGTLSPSTVITASSYDDFARKQQSLMRWFGAGLWLIAVGTALQIVAVVIAP